MMVRHFLYINIVISHLILIQFFCYTEAKALRKG